MENSHLKGIGGWLILPLIGLILTPIAVGLSLSDSMVIFEPELWHSITTYGSEVYHPLFGTWAIFEAALNIFTIAFSIFLLVLMLRKSRLFPAFMIFNFISAVVLNFIDYYLGYLIYTDLPNLADGQSPYIEGFFRALVQAAVWVPYFIRSKRVKVTFLNSKVIIEESDQKSI